MSYGRLSFLWSVSSNCIWGPRVTQAPPAPKRKSMSPLAMCAAADAISDCITLQR